MNNTDKNQTNTTPITVLPAYWVERSGIEIVAHGPNGLEESLHAEEIGIVKRSVGDEPPKPYAVKFGDMSDEELIAYVLGHDAWPYAS